MIIRNPLAKILLSTLLLSSTAFAFAAEAPTPVQSSSNWSSSVNSEEPKINLINLSTRADHVINNDKMTVRLFAEHDAKSSKEAFDKNTEAMDFLFSLQRTGEGKARLIDVKISNGGRRTSPIYDKEKPGVIVGWRDRAEINLESKDFKVLSTLVGELTSDLQVESISFKVSDQARKELEDKLTTKALMQFSQKAEIATKILRGSNYGLVNVTIGEVNPVYEGQYNVRPMMAFSKARGASSAESTVAAGDTKLSVSINGTIQILH